MKLTILALTSFFLATGCATAPAAKEDPAPEPSTAVTGERVQPEIRYYEVADT